MKILKICILILYSSVALANIKAENIDFNEFDKYQFQFTKSEIEKRVKKYLEKDSKIRSHYKVTKDALYIGDLDHNKIDYVLNFKTKKNQKIKKSKNKRSLKGLKIAIDPGHFGGDYARLEDRFTNIFLEDPKEEIFFDEGTLTYLTAMELKDLLVADGAIVFCTRGGIGKGALDDDFFEWLKKNTKHWKSSKALDHLFRAYYNREDLLQRAAKINAFNPDITLAIHYNTNFTQKDSAVKTNYSLAFVPGAFCGGELDKVRNRYEFLRLLVTNHMVESIRLSENLAKQFVTKLKVPLISNNEIASYIDNFCLKQKDGVYSRNLALTRLVHSPVCYGETLIQNNKNELIRLSKKDTTIDNILCSKRIKEVAQAYYDGIKRYLNSR
jgi:N-acetylmuramoyl-L-alanine amidase